MCRSEDPRSASYSGRLVSPQRPNTTSTPCARNISTTAWAPVSVATLVSTGLFTAAVILARHECRRSAEARARRALRRSHFALRRRPGRGGSRFSIFGPESHGDVGAADAGRTGGRVEPLRDVERRLSRAAFAYARHACGRTHACADGALCRR